MHGMTSAFCLASDEDINLDLETLQTPNVDRAYESRLLHDDAVEPDP